MQLFTVLLQGYLNYEYMTETGSVSFTRTMSPTLIKKNIKFSSYIRNIGAVAKSYMTNGLLIYG